MKKLIVLSSLLFLCFIYQSCNNDDDGVLPTTTGCPDETDLVDKWWYSTIAPTQYVSHESYYFHTGGLLSKKRQDGTNEVIAGQWTISCDTINIHDTTSIIADYKYIIQALNDTMLTVKDNYGNTWPYKNHPLN